MQSCLVVCSGAAASATCSLLQPAPLTKDRNTPMGPCASYQFAKPIEFSPLLRSASKGLIKNCSQVISIFTRIGRTWEKARSVLTCHTLVIWAT